MAHRKRIQEIRNKIRQAENESEHHAAHLTVQDINWLIQQTERHLDFQDGVWEAIFNTHSDDLKRYLASLTNETHH